MSKKKVNKVKFLKFSALMILCLYAAWTLITQEVEFSHARGQLGALTEQVREQQQQKVDLEKQKELVNTPEYIEKAARNELGYARPDELVFMDASQN